MENVEKIMSGEIYSFCSLIDDKFWKNIVYLTWQIIKNALFGMTNAEKNLLVQWKNV